MRQYTQLTNAKFYKPGEAPVAITLPHTWNNLDGQDGGGDYYRGTGTYEIPLPNPTPGKRQYIEFQGANHIARVFCNGTELGTHEGGFSTFRFSLTEVLKPENNLLTVEVYNGECHVYPQRADFTFFGGIYRDVRFIEVDKPHFDLLKTGSDAVFVTPRATGETQLDIFPVNAEGCAVRVQLLDAENNLLYDRTQEALPHTQFAAYIPNPHLWDCVEDPYCHRAVVTLLENDTPVDEISVTYGYRSFRMDPQQGFLLNGRPYPLHGVCRHQDRKDKGWAISRADHLEDATLIKELGANTIRLAHYQHDQYFYDLCDQFGFAVWAEIPYISTHMDGQKPHDNTLSQMKELIAQCYNHPSIITWGIGNEITVGGDTDEIYYNQCHLHELAKAMDPYRPTTVAHLNRVPVTHRQTRVTDIQSYNIYYGWYIGSLEDNETEMDKFHDANPDRVYGISEYGVDNLLTWHSAFPINHDYTEEYSVKYHQHMLKAFRDRPWLWATHQWNMFDFAVDTRNEGGVKGLNSKGLITHDRKTKKDAFFLYQAWWTTAPMVHIAGRRFADRAPGERTVLVFTNQDTVSLSLNGKIFTAKAEDHIATFPELPLTDGENRLIATVPGAEDAITLQGVATHNTAYDLPDLAAALQIGNWFLEEDEEEATDYGDEGYHSMMCFKDLLSNPQCMDIVRGWIMSKKDADVSHKFKFTAMLNSFRDNPTYYDRHLRMMPTMISMMQEEDYAVLDKRLRTVKKP